MLRTTLLREWHTPGGSDKATRDARKQRAARELMAMVARELRSGRSLPSALSTWHADCLHEALRTGDTDKAFGLKAGRGQPRKVVTDAMRHAAALFAWHQWNGLQRARDAAPAVAEVLHREPASLVDDLRDCEKLYTLRGPFTVTAEAGADRSAVAMPTSSNAAALCVEFTRGDWAAGCLLVVVPEEVSARALEQARR